MSFIQWVDTPEEWVDTSKLEWIPHIVDTGIVYPIKNFITNNKIPYMFITKDNNYYFESINSI